MSKLILIGLAAATLGVGSFALPSGNNDAEPSSIDVATPAYAAAEIPAPAAALSACTGMIFNRTLDGSVMTVARARGARSLEQFIEVNPWAAAEGDNTIVESGMCVN